MSNVTDEMRAIIGRPYDTSVSFPIDRSDIRRWALAVYYPEKPPAEYIAGDIAPEEFNPFAWLPAERKGPGPEVTQIEVGREYHLAGATEQILGVQPPPLTHGLNGGIEIIYGDADMHPGDVITSTVSISEYSEREGRLGLMLFTTYDHVWTNQRGQHVKTQRLTYIRY